MVCQNCGTQLSDGTPSCPTCGAPLMAPQQPYTAAPAAPAKSGNGKMIGIIAAVIAVVAIVVVAVMLLGGGKYNGKYELVRCSFGGEEEYTIAEMEAMMPGDYNMTLTVRGRRCTLESSEDKGVGKITFDGNDITVEDDVDTFTGTYDPDAKTITLDMYGVGMVFELVD